MKKNIGNSGIRVKLGEYGKDKRSLNKWSYQLFQEISPDKAMPASNNEDLAYLKLGKGPAQRAQFDCFTMKMNESPFRVDELKDERVCLALVPGVKMQDARTFYSSIETLNSLLALKSNHRKIIELNCDLFFQHINSPRVYAHKNMIYHEYFTFWHNHIPQIRRWYRDENASFQHFYRFLLKNQLISEDDIQELEIAFQQRRNASYINLFPSTNIRYRWSYDEAVRLDAEDKLVQQVKTLLPEILACWGQEIDIV